MTSIEWLRNKLYQHEHHINILDVATINGYFEQAKEMHKQEITDAFDSGVEDDGYIDNAEQYYQETFVSKGSDFKQFSLYEHKDTITSADTPVSKTFLESIPKQETLYTEEQMRKAYEYGNNYHKGSIADAQEYTFEKLIQSLKQPM